MIRFLMAAAILLVPFQLATADIKQIIEFDVTGFAVGAPQDPVIGSIKVTADPSNDNIVTGLLAINLNIDGYQYTLGEIGFINPGADSTTIGGTVNTVAIVNDGVEDFSLTFNHKLASFANFVYSTVDTEFEWFGNTNNSFSVSPIPEPSAGFGLAIAATAFLTTVRRRRK